MNRKIKIGTRGSDLALCQANSIKDKLKELKITCELKIIKTQGDEIQDIGFDKMEGKGFFTKELEKALLSKEIDLAVHSMKDMETTATRKLKIAAVTAREEPNDLLIINTNAVDKGRRLLLKDKAIVGTSSARRKSQILAFRNDVVVNDLRGNVPTRIEKLESGDYDAIIIAAAGVNRLELDLTGFHVENLDPTEFVPAPAQGALACQIRKDDKWLDEKLAVVNHAGTELECNLERTILNKFGGGCQMPIGVYCRQEEDEDEQIIYKVWTAISKKAKVPPVVIFQESKSQEKVVEAIVERHKSVRSASVYITRDLRKDDFFKNVLEGNGYKVKGTSLIDIRRLDYKDQIKDKKHEWVFFSSKQAVVHFFEQDPELGPVKYAALGKATAGEMRKYGARADFVGYSTDTKLTGRQFASSVTGLVLFPQARGSMRVIQRQFGNQDHVQDLVVYETLKKDVPKMPEADIILFTSPSNVIVYCNSKKLALNQRVIAMGNATGNELLRQGVEYYTLVNSFDDSGLAQAVFGM
ncbi:MAG: hydroxymethylbilane synthase [Bacteroidetes bacterium]|nr:MAG: hydroxymethylbilane synthase [Bacteroidota bacterium]